MLMIADDDEDGVSRLQSFPGPTFSNLRRMLLSGP